MKDEQALIRWKEFREIGRRRISMGGNSICKGPEPKQFGVFKKLNED